MGLLIHCSPKPTEEKSADAEPGPERRRAVTETLNAKSEERKLAPITSRDLSF